MTIGLHIKTAIVTGANGFIGRWLISELTAHGVAVTALVRRPEDRAEELREWVTSHGETQISSRRARWTRARQTSG